MRITSSLITSAVLVIALAGCASVSGQQGQAQFGARDSAASRAVLQASLASDLAELLPDVRIAVAVGANGVVTLTGQTTTQADKDKITNRALGYPGVMKIQNNILVLNNPQVQNQRNAPAFPTN